MGHTWGMVHRTITGMSGLPRTLRTCHLPAEMFAASRSLWTGFFLTRKRTEVQLLPRPLSPLLPALSVAKDCSLPYNKAKAWDESTGTAVGERLTVLSFEGSYPMSDRSHRPAICVWGAA